MAQFQVLNEHCRWMIGVGGLRFWKDNWAGEILEGPQPSYVLRQCMKLLGEDYQVRHIFRQKNRVADSLAAYAHAKNGRMEFRTPTMLPISI